MRLGARPLHLFGTVLLVLVTLPAAVSGQSLEERELEYRAALGAYESAVQARNVLAFRQDAVLDSLTRARATGDQSLIDRLEGQARQVGLQFASRSTRVTEMSDAFEEVRGALLDALDQRLDSLQQVIQGSTSESVRLEAGTLIADLRTQFAGVEAQDLEETIPLRSLVLPAVTIEPRDTPASLLRKAQLLESRAQAVQREIDEVEDDLDRFRRNAQLARFSGDATSATDRFGDRTVPVRSQTTDGRAGRTPVADSTVVDLDALSPEDAIVALERYRQQLIVIRDETIQRANELRSRLTGVRGVGGSR